jgi:hypothetical protein
MTDPLPDDLIRLFSDYSETVIWFDNFTSYEESGLSTELIGDLRAWDESYYAGLENYEWRSREAGRTHRREGRRLARHLADEVGADFAVEVDGHRVRSGREARSPEAAAAFRAMRASSLAERERIQALIRGGARLEWLAYPPGDPRNR